jgi:hypothetical protein
VSLLKRAKRLRDWPPIVVKYKFIPVSRAYLGIISDQTGQNYDTLIFGDGASPFADDPD